MNEYFAYIRVSTPKQGKGVSLEEQQSAIKTHAERQGIGISEWFEERETAAKAGRAIFSKMLVRLERGEAKGVIIHKIDRSARNLWDWANLSKLFDRGIDVQFAHDSLDLKSRGGRLSADIMAIVAADYVRNLREEVKKGFYGRLKQGLYPLPAPIGYLDRGPGNPKSIDPDRAPFVQQAFTRYATGTVGLKHLRKELRDSGLRTRSGKPISLTGLSIVLNNPFYAGLIRIRRTGETFEGQHPPMVSMDVFNRVKAILHAKSVLRFSKHDYVFRRLATCAGCGYHLIGERQKGHVYYRCHGEECKGTILREEALDAEMQSRLKLLIGDKREMGEIRDMVEEKRASESGDTNRLRQAIGALLGKCSERQLRLTDALIDQLIDKDAFEVRKRALLEEKKQLEYRLARVTQGDLPRKRALVHLELANAAHSGYISGNSAERRRIIDRVTSNLSVHQKNIAITLQSPYREIADWRKSQHGPPRYCASRTRARELLAMLEVAECDSDLPSVLELEREVKEMRERAEAAISSTSPKSTERGSRPIPARRLSTSRVERRARLPRGSRRKMA